MVITSNYVVAVMLRFYKKRLKDINIDICTHIYYIYIYFFLVDFFLVDFFGSVSSK